MNGCDRVQGGFTEYLDGRLNGSEMQAIDAHLRRAGSVPASWNRSAMRRPRWPGWARYPSPATAPAIRVAVSQERARSRGVFRRLGMAWKNTVGPFCCRASAGFASAVLLLGGTCASACLRSPKRAQAKPHEPLGNATAPRLIISEMLPAKGDGRHLRPSSGGGPLNRRAKGTISASSGPAMSRPVPGGEPARTAACAGWLLRPARPRPRVSASPESPYGGKEQGSGFRGQRSEIAKTAH